MALEASLYEKLDRDGVVKCNVCPRRCFIKRGGRGFCKVRENRDGKLYVLNFSKLTAMNIDPVEKKPFFNFWPGSLSFSISSISCSFTCPWCQNWGISQAGPGEVSAEEVEPGKVVSLAKKYGCRSVSYTYNEPIIWFEYVLEASKLARKEGILNLLVTNGYATEEAIQEFSRYVDAANVDVKSFSPDFYTKYCKARLEDVLGATEVMVEKGWHVEVTYLIIPKLNDDPELLRGVSRWVLNSLGADVPLHFSQFYPMYKMTYLNSTPPSTIEKARDIALEEGLHYVYVGNIPGHPGENTYCPKCRLMLVKRWGFDVLEWKLTERMTCPSCDTKIAIKGTYERRKRSFI